MALPFTLIQHFWPNKEQKWLEFIEVECDYCHIKQINDENDCFSTQHKTKLFMILLKLTNLFLCWTKKTTKKFVACLLWSDLFPLLARICLFHGEFFNRIYYRELHQLSHKKLLLLQIYFLQIIEF